VNNGTLLADGARPAVRLERQLPDPPSVVWEALTDREQLRSWFPCDVVVAGGRWKVGAAITFAFPPEVIALTLTGEVLAVDEPHALAFTWGEETLRFELSPANGGTHLVLWTSYERESPPATRLVGRRVSTAWPDSIPTRTRGGRASTPTWLRSSRHSDRRRARRPATEAIDCEVPPDLARDQHAFGRRLGEVHHAVRVGDHGDMATGDLDCGCAHTTGEHALDVGWDGLIVLGDHVPGRQRFPGRDSHLGVKGGRGQRLLHGVHDLGLDRIDVSGEVVDVVVLR
jgi:uncharacterized protein YndB with AHSA1/START domain